MQNSNTTERLQWVDAMRGFSMLLVVLGHVLLNMGIGGYDSFLSSLLLTFRMPLFFFVSGYFSYRMLSWWNKNRITDILKRKIQAQVLCTVLFVSVYQYVMWGGVDLSDGFGGYWFTIVLFQMYILYLILSVISRLIHADVVIPSLIVISAAFVAILVASERDTWIWNFLCWENLTKYMQFFTLGLICSKYKNKFYGFLENNIAVTLMVVGWVVCMILWYNPDFKESYTLAYSFVHDIAVRYFGLMTVIMMFFGSRKFYAGDSKCSRSLRFIGQRTLDIYMIHYFLVPDLSVLTPWLQSGNTVIFQLAIGLGVSIAVTAACLLVSSILRKSATLEMWLFGVKPSTATPARPQRRG